MFFQNIHLLSFLHYKPKLKNSNIKLFAAFKLLISLICAAICHHLASGYKAPRRLLALGHVDIYNDINLPR